MRSNLGFLKNSIGDWSTREKLIVIESDDWGSMRMPSKKSYNNLLNKGIKVQDCPFLKYDSFETPEDFAHIENTFDKVFYKTGKKPVITANYIMANPDFDKIRENNYSKYYRKFFFDFLKEQDNLEHYRGSLTDLQEKGYFFPQLHGMEHLNVLMWMESLRKNLLETRTAFDQYVYGISVNITTENRGTYLAALDYSKESEYENFIKDALKEAYKAFKLFFGYNSKSFIAPNYIWSSNIEKLLSELGVSFIQSSRYQILPRAYSEKSQNRKLGMTNEYDQLYLVRNCIFEPSTVENKRAHMQRCFQQIRNAFLLHKPAVISMHKLNFMGGLHKKNREENLKLLSNLLISVINKWPKTQILHSAELGQRIFKSQH